MSSSLSLSLSLSLSHTHTPKKGFPGGASGKEPTYPTYQCRRLEFDPWVGKIPWGRALQPTPVFLTGESHGQRSLAGNCPWGGKELDTAESSEHAPCTHKTQEGGGARSDDSVGLQSPLGLQRAGLGRSEAAYPSGLTGG